MHISGTGVTLKSIQQVCIVAGARSKFYLAYLCL